MILTTMKLKHFYLIILISLFAQQAIAQTFDDHYMIGWKADQPLTFDLFEGQPTDDQIKKMKEKNLYAEMGTRLWSVLDVPSSKRGWKSKIEKAYFCPIFDKNMGFFIKKDSTQLKRMQLLWDVKELSCRIARYILDQEQHKADSLAGGQSNGIVFNLYMTALNNAKEFGRGLSNYLSFEVYAKDNDSIFQEQRALVDQRLAELAKYATTDEDIRRQVTNQPEKGYKMAEKIMGDLKKRPDISY